MRTTPYLRLATLIVALAASPLAAGTFQHMGLEKLVRASNAAIEGEVLGTSSYWDAEGRIIVTEADVLVADRVFGESASVVKVKTFGGKVGNYTIQAPGFPTFEKGERLFLFVRTDEGDPSMQRVTGYQQGQFYVVNDDNNVARAESALRAGANLIDMGQEDGLPAELSLSELKELVRAQAEIVRAEKQQDK